MSQSLSGHTPPQEGRFKRSLGWLEILFIGFGAMIGFGWVTLTSGWLIGAGTMGTVVAFIIGAAIMALVGLVYAELVSAMPLAGESTITSSGVSTRVSPSSGHGESSVGTLRWSLSKRSRSPEPSPTSFLK